MSCFAGYHSSDPEAGYTGRFAWVTSALCLCVRAFRALQATMGGDKEAGYRRRLSWVSPMLVSLLFAEECTSCFEGYDLGDGALGLV